VLKIILATIGGFKSRELESLLADYLKLAGKFAAAEHVEIPVPRGTTEERAQDAVVLNWLEKRGSRVFLTLLDEKGKLFTSRELARQVEKIRDGSHTEWIVACAGARGFGPGVKEKSRLTWSLSPLTFPHELAATVAAEQIFRALSILAGHPYHND
jgi:23S rRNA (pseudouridine1915-N3)-methyltransferase